MLHTVLDPYWSGLLKLIKHTNFTIVHHIFIIGLLWSICIYMSICYPGIYLYTISHNIKTTWITLSRSPLYQQNTYSSRHGLVQESAVTFHQDVLSWCCHSLISCDLGPLQLTTSQRRSIKQRSGEIVANSTAFCHVLQTICNVNIFDVCLSDTSVFICQFSPRVRAARPS